MGFPVVRQRPRHAPLELGGFRRILLFITGHEPLPAAFRGRAALARIPAFVHFLRDFERRVRPADRLARCRDFLFAQRRAMGRTGVRLVGRTLADRRFRADQRRPRFFALCLADRLVDRRGIVPVHIRDHLPAVSLEAAFDVVGVPLLDLAFFGVDRDAVVVVNRDQLRKPERAGERARFVRDALHQAAVAGEYIGMVIDDVETVAVEFGGEHAFGDRHADRIGQPLPERAGSRLHARRAAVFGVSRRPGMQLPKLLDIVDRQVVAGQMQQPIEQHRAVAVGQHEPVAIGPARVGRIMSQVMIPQDLGNIGHAHRHPGMAGVGLLYSIHGQRTQGVGQFDTGFH